MPPRDSRTVSDLAREQRERERARRRRVRLKRSSNSKNPEPGHRDAPRARTVLGAHDLPSERPDFRVRNFATGEVVEDRPGLGLITKPLGTVTKPIGEWFVREALGGQAPKRPGSSAAVRAANDPRLRGASAGTRAAFDVAVGPESRKLLQGLPHSNLLAGVEVASILPIARPLRGSRAASKGIRAALKEGAVEAGYRAAEDVYEGSSVARKAINKIPTRDRRLNDAVASVAAARSRTGRAAERAIDKARPVIGKIPGLKTPEQVWARDAERRIIHDSKVEALPGVLADASIKKLNRAQKYALYAMGTETSPERWIDFYAKQLQTEQDPLVRSAIKAHIANFDKARKYVSEGADGSLEVLGGKGADKLQRAYTHLAASSEAREAILTRGGYLDPDAIIARRSAPGRIARGARWTPEEIHAQEVIRNAPSRQKLAEDMAASGVDPDAIEAQLNILDHRARAHWQHSVDRLKKQQKTLRRRLDEALEGDDEAAIAQLTNELADVEGQIERGIPYDDLYQRLATSAPHFPEVVQDAIRSNFPDSNLAFQRNAAEADNVLERGLAEGAESANEGRVLGGPERERGASGADDVSRAADSGATEGGVDLAGSGRLQGGNREPAIPRTDEQVTASWRGELEPGVPTNLVHGAHIPLGDVSGVYVSEHTLHPTETWTHELTHFWQTYFPGVEKKLERILGPSKEDWVEAYMEYVLDPDLRRLPKAVEKEFKKLSGAILKEAYETGGARFVAQGMPRRLAELFDTTLWHEELKGGALRGAEDFTGGSYLPRKNSLR